MRPWPLGRGLELSDIAKAIGVPWIDLFNIQKGETESEIYILKRLEDLTTKKRRDAF